MSEIAAGGPAGKAAAKGLFGAYGKLLPLALKRRGVDPADIEDVAQELWLEILRAARRYRGDAPVRHFLFVLMRDARSRYFVSLHRQPPLISLDEEDEHGTLAGAAQAEPSSEAGWLDFVDCVRRAYAAFERKHPRLARLLLLRHVEELSLDEIAEEVGGNAPKARDTLFSARRKFAPDAQPCLSLWPSRGRTI